MPRPKGPVRAIQSWRVVARGLRTSQTRTLDGGAPVTVNYQYDQQYRLVSAGTWDGNSLIYTYDQLGNIDTATAKVPGGADVEIETYILYGGTSPHAGMNRLKTVRHDMNADGDTADSGDYIVDYQFDQNGNMTARDVTYPNGGGTNEAWEYSYDYDDRMTAVVKDSATVAEYLYDPFGRRVLKDTGSDVEVYFYDREDVVAEWDGETVVRRYVHGPGVDDYVAMVDVSGGGTYYYHTDGLGSVTDMTTQAGATVTTRYQYAPFGAASALAGYTALEGTNPYEYTGRRYDPESGLMYYRSRYYSPEQRRRLRGVLSPKGTAV